MWSARVQGWTSQYLVVKAYVLYVRRSPTESTNAWRSGARNKHKSTAQPQNDSVVYFSARRRSQGPFKDIVYVKSLQDASSDASHARKVASDSRS